MSALVSARDSRIKPNSESRFKKISNNVDLYNDVRKCFFLNLPNTLIFYWKFLFNMTLNLSQLFRFKLFNLFSNTLKCVNLIEIRFYAYLYTPSFLVFWYIMFDTTVQTPEVEFGSQYGYLFEDKYRYWPWGQIVNTDFRLLLDMQKPTYCNKICDNHQFSCNNPFII
jgi:hypothetical protein